MLINGHDLHVERHGPQDGPSVVLLHHGLGSVRAWKEQVPLLTQAGWQVIVYDRWGYGSSEPRPSLDLPSFTTDLADLQAILEEFSLMQTALVGHSDGGTIALYFAAQHPHLVSCIVVVAAHIYLEPKMKPGILGISQAYGQDERFRQGLRHAHGEKYESTFHNWFDGWQRMEPFSWDMRPTLARIHCPVLVVQGEHDEHATPQHARDIAAAIPGAELWLLPEAGHMLPQEHAEIFNIRLLQFLEAHHA